MSIVSIEYDVPVEMRDGTILSADVEVTGRVRAVINAMTDGPSEVDLRSTSCRWFPATPDPDGAPRGELFGVR